MWIHRTPWIWVHGPQVRALALEPPCHTCCQPVERERAQKKTSPGKSFRAKPEIGMHRFHPHSTRENVATCLYLPARETGKYHLVCVPRKKRQQIWVPSYQSLPQSTWHVWPSRRSQNTRSRLPRKSQQSPICTAFCLVLRPPGTMQSFPSALVELPLAHTLRHCVPPSNPARPQYIGSLQLRFGNTGSRWSITMMEPHWDSQPPQRRRSAHRTLPKRSFRRLPWSRLCPLGNFPLSTVFCGHTWSGHWEVSFWGEGSHCFYRPLVALGSSWIRVFSSVFCFYFCFFRPWLWFLWDFNFFLQIDFRLFASHGLHVPVTTYTIS